MDDLAIGRLFRQLRIRLGWRATDVAEKARVSTATYSRIERGKIGSVRVDTLRRTAAILDVRIPLEPRWRGAALDRVLNERHAVMAEAVTRLLIDNGWEVRPEVSFSHFGERGVVDLVAWHPVHRTLLLVELKTELADVNDLLEVTGRRRRLAAVIAEPLGWRPSTVAQWVVLAPGRTNARHLANHRSMIRAAFPADGRSLAGWLANPRTPASTLWFLPNDLAARRGRTLAPTTRVRVRRPSVVAPTKRA